MHTRQSLVNLVGRHETLRRYVNMFSTSTDGAQNCDSRVPKAKI